MILFHANSHPAICIIGESWYFLEDMEDTLGDKIMICGDLILDQVLEVDMTPSYRDALYSKHLKTPSSLLFSSNPYVPRGVTGWRGQTWYWCSLS